MELVDGLESDLGLVKFGQFITLAHLREIVRRWFVHGTSIRQFGPPAR
jgi:hypothetical protein